MQLNPNKISNEGHTQTLENGTCASEEIENNTLSPGTTLEVPKNGLSTHLKVVCEGEELDHPTISATRNTSVNDERSSKRFFDDAGGLDPTSAKFDGSCCKSSQETLPISGQQFFDPRIEMNQHPPCSTTLQHLINPVTFNNYVAVALLTSSAVSVGMTLQQLSRNLAEVPHLSQVLSTGACPESKLALAGHFFEIESRALLQKSMLLAGMDDKDTSEGSYLHTKIAKLAHEDEGKRLQDLMQRISQHKAVQEASLKSRCRRSAPKTVERRRRNRTARTPRGRHVHRRGKCGHMAILHRPPGKPAHIDFIVGDKIECFEGVKPIGGKGESAEWLSSFLCEEIKCTADAVTNPSNHSNCSNCSLTEVDFSGDDFFANDSDDDVLVGLLKLCETKQPKYVEA